MGLTDTVSRYFDLDGRGSDLRTESIAGLTTFLTMSYIIVVNPALLSIVISPEGVSDVRVFQMLAVVTILASVAGMLVMAFYADLPFGLAPGMGLNAFFVTVVLSPTLNITWQTALAAVFVEGIVFVALTLVGAREYVINLFPEPVKLGVGAGIGLFLASIGLQFMRITAVDPDDMMTLSPVLAQDPVAIVAVIGILLTFFLYVKGIRGAIVLGILTTAVMGYIAGALGFEPFSGTLPKEGQILASDVTLAPGIDQITYGASAYDITPLVGAFLDGIQGVEAVTFAFVVFTFFFVDFFDTAGTLTGLGQEAGYLDEDGDFPEMNKPLMADAVGTTIGSILGTSTVTTFVESSTGIEEGGRTGLTALVIAALFLVALIFVPLVGAIPSFAPYVALVIVAVFMVRNVTEIKWEDPAHAIPATLTIALMPLTSSIATGIAAGLVSYPIVKGAQGEVSDVRLGQWALAALVILYYFVRTNALV
ncbi:NCS2 family permease [Halodesulfurarchaeum sp. HSR-GB]|uniref:NCS2 family permease n=1 Tax=Halodesulfurarchaeum sp. HSR-GB TaxID=3074077 RepID=UPI00285CD897|nr:NCS2 family permease [Halodesulfurarchaeum sp. HSR-GB]MDR5655897.1 NCS2 family permease [Halodesulfurarchaeum sp. HSR-GB]